jgi:hypothetical protein
MIKMCCIEKLYQVLQGLCGRKYKKVRPKRKKRKGGGGSIVDRQLLLGKYLSKE